MKNIILAFAVICTAIVFFFTTKVEAGGLWSDQYCDVETTAIRVVDQNGNVIEERTEEKVTCNDGAKDFLHGFGIADNCQIYTWQMPLGETLITQRDIACHKLDGGYEIVKGYHGME